MTFLICSFVCCGFVMDCQRGRLLWHMCFTCLEHMSWFYVIGLSFDKTHFTCIWVDLGCFKYFKKPCFKIKYWNFQVCSRKQVRSAKSLKLDSWSTAVSIELKETVLHSVCLTPSRQLLDTCYLSRFKIFRISIWFSWDPWMCLWAFFSPKPSHIKGSV